MVDDHLLLLGDLDLDRDHLLIDIFRRQDIGGWAKAAWVIFVVILPWLGVLVYLIVQHDGMRERSMKQVQADRRAFDDHVRDTAGGGFAAEIAKAKSCSTPARSRRRSSRR